MSHRGDVVIRLAGAMRNGSRLEAVGRSVHRRLTECANPEFRERLHAALLDEVRHETTQRELADRLWDGPLVVSGGVHDVGRAVGSSDPLWTMVTLNIVERAFEIRLRAIARRARQLGFRFMYWPLMEAAQDEERHVVLVTEMLRDAGRSVDRWLIERVAAWNAMNEAQDTSGFFPRDGLIPRMAERLIEEIE